MRVMMEVEGIIYFSHNRQFRSSALALQEAACVLTSIIERFCQTQWTRHSSSSAAAGTKRGGNKWKKGVIIP
jgi:hypothetical protein